MGWYISNLISCGKGGCQRVSGKSNYMIFNLSSSNETGIKEAKKMMDYFDTKEKHFSKFLKYDDKLGKNIQINFVYSNGMSCNLFKGKEIKKSDYDGIYNMIQL